MVTRVSQVTKDGTDITGFTQMNTDLGGNISVSGGLFVGQFSNQSPNDSSVARHSTSLTNDQYAKIALPNVSNVGGANERAGVWVRASGSGVTRSGYEFIMHQTSGTVPAINLNKWVNGTRTNLATSTTALANNDTIEIEVEGTTLRAMKNGTAIGGAFTTTDADLSSGSAGLTCTTSGQGDNWEAGNLISATMDQEGFRWGNDDGNEASFTFAATQDTSITAALGTNKLLRMLIDMTDGPLARSYALRYQKNGAGGYSAVPVGSADYKVQPVIEAADCTVSGNNTAEATWAVSHPAAVAGDLLIFYVAWDDSTTTTDAAEPAGPNSEVLTEINATPATDASTETRAKAWYTVATGSWSASTVTFTPTATESWTATVVKVPAGEFEAADPIGDVGTSAASGTADTNVVSPAYTAGSTDGSGTLLWFASVDADPLATLDSGWTSLQTQDLGSVAHGVAVRTAAVTNSESIASANWSIAGDSWTSIAVIVRAPTYTPQVYVATSANITAGGEDTTARLTAPGAKSTSDFVTGRRWDNENGSDSVNISVANDYTEIEWCLNTQSPAVNTDYFDFRVYAGSSAIESYTVTPRWTIGTGGVSGSSASSGGGLSSMGGGLSKAGQPSGLGYMG